MLKVINKPFSQKKLIKILRALVEQMDTLDSPHAIHNFDKFDLVIGVSEKEITKMGDIDISVCNSDSDLPTLTEMLEEDEILLAKYINSYIFHHISKIAKMDEFKGFEISFSIDAKKVKIHELSANKRENALSITAKILPTLSISI